jgi:hypothetical protein
MCTRYSETHKVRTVYKLKYIDEVDEERIEKD